jgi:Xaa-Pro dipeptidase
MIPMTEKNHSEDLYAAHVVFTQKRWEQALENEGFDTVVVHAGTPMVSFLDDHEYPFRPNRHFLAWLPLTQHHDSVLIVRAGRKPVLYYYQPDDYWYLPPSDPATWWSTHFDLHSVKDTDEWKAGLNGGRTAYIGDAPALESVAGNGSLNPERLVNRLHLLRTCKTPYEIACISEANQIAARAHRAAEQAFREGLSEFDIHQRYCQAAGHNDDELPYGNIVALGTHGAVLHYQQRERRQPDFSRSFLIDAGATRHGYASDITRTYSSVPGRFADMIEAMNTMQLGLCDAVRAGRDYRELHLLAHREIAIVLRDFDVIKCSEQEAVDSGLTSVFYPHGLGHYLGLQTHDAAGLIADENGTPIPRPDGHPFLRLTRTLEPGNVLTIEPGLYFIDSLLRKWRENGDTSAINWNTVEDLAPYGGIRIEDNMVVTEAAPLNLTREAFAAGI